MRLSRPIYRDKDLWKYKKRYTVGFNAITQLFGENDVPFYKTLGMKGHNGVDFLCNDGEPIYASHSGKVTKIYDKGNSNKTKGFGVYITHKDGYTTVYWHLLDCSVKLGDEVKDGQLIGHADNSGEYTTGTHLHWGLYPKDRDWNNGFHGAIDPLPFINNSKKMKIIGDKRDNKQYIAGDDKKLHWIFNEVLLETFHSMGAIDKNVVEWKDNLDEYILAEPFVLAK